MTVATYTKNQQLDQLIDHVEVLCLRQSDGKTKHQECQKLDQKLREIAGLLKRKEYEIEKLDTLFASINKGTTLEEMLEAIYREFRLVIPYNRIGFAKIKEDQVHLQSAWVKSDQMIVRIRKGYTGLLTNSSLRAVLEGGQPRIINDLKEYARKNPSSKATRLIIEEGMRSSLTCPLIIKGRAVGFLFFSSVKPFTYQKAHVALFMRIANSLAVALERTQFIEELSTRQDEIERQNQQLRLLNQQKNSFLAIAAHDLRSPMAYGKLLIELLNDQRTSLQADEKQLLLGTLKQKIDYALDLLDDLLNLAQIESGKLTLDLQEFSLDKMIAEVAQAHQQFAKPKDIKVVFEPRFAVDVKADRTKINQVLDNLVSNAIKYSAAGTTVTILQEQHLGGVKVTVRDQGPGIAKEQQEKLFIEFSRLGHKPTGNEHSTGLGLAISKKIVEAHGGQIGVESEPGKGAAFWFVLP